MARDEERQGMHRGADDNASGVAAMLEIAQSMATQKRAGKLKLEHDVLFVLLGRARSLGFSDQTILQSSFSFCIQTFPKWEKRRQSFSNHGRLL